MRIRSHAFTRNQLCWTGRAGFIPVTHEKPFCFSLFSPVTSFAGRVAQPQGCAYKGQLINGDESDVCLFARHTAVFVNDVFF